MESLGTDVEFKYRLPIKNKLPNVEAFLDLSRWLSKVVGRDNYNWSPERHMLDPVGDSIYFMTEEDLVMCKLKFKL